jgi:hypothetical protein
MSTTFGILIEQVDHDKLVDEDGELHFYISRTIFEPIFFRRANSRWFNNGQYLADDLKVYALDNTQQGIYTIKDIKEFLKNKI